MLPRRSCSVTRSTAFQRCRQLPARLTTCAHGMFERTVQITPADIEVSEFRNHQRNKSGLLMLAAAPAGENWPELSGPAFHPRQLRTSALAACGIAKRPMAIPSPRKESSRRRIRCWYRFRRSRASRFSCSDTRSGDRLPEQADPSDHSVSAGRFGRSARARVGRLVGTSSACR